MATIGGATETDDEPNGRVRLDLFPRGPTYRTAAPFRAWTAVNDDDATTLTLSVPDAIADEGDASDMARIRLDLSRGLRNGEVLGIPLQFSGGSPGADFTLSLLGNPDGVSLAPAKGVVTVTGPNSGASATQVDVMLTAAQDHDAVGETVAVSIPASSATGTPRLTAEGLGGGAEGSGSGSITLAEDDTPFTNLQTSAGLSTANAAPGGSFTLSATVTNAGNQASTATTLRYYRSSDATITTSDTQVGTDPVGVLQGLGTSSGSVALTAPSTPGIYYFGACVDAVAGESSTTDNCSSSVSVMVAVPPAPNLQVGTPTVDDATLAPGDSFTLSATVTNAGDANAAATTLRYYRSTDATITTSDTAAGTDPVGTLAASGTSPESINLTAPTTPGTYHYGACVDAVAGESDTADNCSASVSVVVAAPNLRVTSPAVDDAIPAPGGPFTLSATVTNAGDASAAATTLRYYRSTDATITTSDTAAGTDPVGALSAAATSPESINLTAPTTPGTYHYGACVDAVAGESDTADNCSMAVSVAVSVPPAPNLRVDSPTVTDASPAPGGPFTLSATVRNVGSANAAATTLRYYRSTDATITTSDTAAGTDPVGALAASGTSLESIALTAPTTPGTYRYGACVDTVVGESSTADNCSTAVTVTVAPPSAPNLRVTSPTVDDATPAPGGPFTLSATVRNAGSASAATTTLRYYRSADSTITTSDTQVGTDSVGALSPSGTSRQSIGLTAPSAPGTYRYGACVDAVQGESSTSDNCSSAATVIVSPPPPPPPPPPGGGGGGGGGGSANDPLRVDQPIPDQEVAAWESVEVPLGLAFFDPGRETLEYAAASSNPAVAGGCASRNIFGAPVLALWGLKPGAARIRVTAQSPDGERASQDFLARVPGPQGLWLVPSVTDPDRLQGFVRLLNGSDAAASASLLATDDRGTRRGPLTLRVASGAARGFNSLHLEDGDLERGIPEGIGPGEGHWRLAASGPPSLEALAYLRTADGFVTAMRALAPVEPGAGCAWLHRVATFNPASNWRQRSLLRIINPSDADVSVAVTGIDDAGNAGRDALAVDVPAGHALHVSAEELERALGDGTGKWRLRLEAPRPLPVMSLMRSPTGHLSNLSGGPSAPLPVGAHPVWLLPSASDPDREGFVRVTNRSAVPGEVRIEAFGPDGRVATGGALSLAAAASAHFNSNDLELGNAAKGLRGGTGPGDGDWWLRLSSELDLAVHPHVRSRLGFVTAMAAAAPEAPDSAAGARAYRVAFLNPGRNDRQVGRLRLVNPGAIPASVSITGTDDAGTPGAAAFAATVPARGALELRAADGDPGPGLESAFGMGAGKWRLRVASDRHIAVLSLLEAPTGHLTNLSAAAQPPAE